MSIPKKPLAVSRAKKKLPLELDWGPGVLKDRLAYINSEEKALIQRFRKTKAARDYAGIPAFASDSASSKGNERGADGPSGVGRGSSAGSGPSSAKSSSSGSKSPSSATGGGSKSSSSSSSRSSAASTGTSKAPNAAAQAASNAYKSAQSASKAPATNAAASTPTSKAPNAAAAYASQKLNATSNALKTASQPKSIQGMINSGSTAPNAAAASASKAYTDKWGFYDRIVSNSPSAMSDVIDLRGKMGPFKGPLPGGLMADKEFGNFNPNAPLTREALNNKWDQFHEQRDAMYRSDAKKTLGPDATPNEIREYARTQDRMMKAIDERLQRNRNGYSIDGSPTKSGITAEGRNSISSAVPDIGLSAGYSRPPSVNPSVNPSGTSTQWGGNSVPQSIQGMINSGSTAPNAAAQAAYDKQKMAAISERYDPVVKGASVPVKGTLPGVSPADFVRTGLAYNVNKMDKMNVTDARRIVDGYNNIKQFADVRYNPDQVNKITDKFGYTPVGIRTNNPGNMRPPAQEQWQREVPGYTGPVTSPNGTVYQSYSDPRWGLVGQNELLGKYHDWGRTTISSVVDKYAPVMKGENTATQNKNYKEHLSRATGWGVDQELTREQVQSLGPYKTTFENGGALFAGGPFGGTTTLAASKPPVGAATGLSVAVEPSAPRPQSIPSPDSMDILGNPTRAPSMVAGDPRVSMPPGSFPAASRAPTPIAGDPRVSMPPGSFPSASQRAPLGPPRLPDASTIVMGDPRVSMPPGGFPAAPSRATSQIAGDPRVSMPPGSFPAAPSVQSGVVSDPRVSMSLPANIPGYKPPATGPSTYNPVSAPEDVPVYSDNPVQGPQNPMQEGPQVEGPGVVKARQQKYANSGAAIGSVIAGLPGAIIGGTLGWQMGKTSPQQREAIASNPGALKANVDSINRMVEERGGKGNLNMRVTEYGMKVILSNPGEVTKNPQKFTTLEQMLAALAQGIDPETGKPIV